MTNAEAIEVLRANYPDACYEQLREAVDMAIEALKAQLFHDGTTSDLISRQQTLNTLMDAVKSVGVLDADDIKTVFDALPSVQHEKAQLSWEGTTKDTISRQAAIDALCSKCAVDKPETCSTIQKGDNWCEEVYILQNVPSVQPEVRTGEWTLGFDNKYMEKYYYCSCCGGRKYGEHEPLDYFCSNCGADMRGEKDERTD